jgi:hypothetical protein
MRLELLCPACGVRDFDFDEYESLVLLAPNLALAQFSCSRCGIHLSATLKLTPEMRHRVHRRLNADDALSSEAVGESLEPSEASLESVAPLSPNVSSVGGGVPDAPPSSEALPSETREPPRTSRSPQPPASLPDPSLLSYASSLVVSEGDPSLEVMWPLRIGSNDVKARLEYFKRQLEVIETVDEAIEEIGTGFYQEKRDV